MNNRWYNPSPTVTVGRVPLYLQGLGDDIPLTDMPISDTLVEPTFSSPDPLVLSPGSFDTTMFDPGGSLTFHPSGAPLDSNQVDIANMYAGAVASGALHPGDAAALAAAAIGAGAGAIKSFTGGGVNLPPGPSPRVNTRAVPSGSSLPAIFTQQAIHGIPNWMLFAFGGVALLGAMGKR